MSKKVNKQKKLKPFEKLLTVMISGKVVSKEEIEALLGKEIYMYRISTYMWHIKTFANGVVKTAKDGRKAIGYQIVNVDEVKKYMKQNDVPMSLGKKTKAVESLKELQPVVEAAEVAAPTIVAEVKDKNDLVVTEITED